MTMTPSVINEIFFEEESSNYDKHTNKKYEIDNNNIIFTFTEIKENVEFKYIVEIYKKKLIEVVDKELYTKYILLLLNTLESTIYNNIALYTNYKDIVNFRTILTKQDPYKNEILEELNIWLNLIDSENKDVIYSFNQDFNFFKLKYKDSSLIIERDFSEHKDLNEDKLKSFNTINIIALLLKVIIEHIDNSDKINYDEYNDLYFIEEFKIKVIH